MIVVLASQSPRRQELIRYLLPEYLTDPSDFSERSVPYNGDPAAYAITLAKEKAQDVAMRHPCDLILGADTIVVLDEEVLNKPKDRSDARRMIRRLQGRSHTVITAYAILWPEKGIERLGYEATEVHFASMDALEIEDYLSRDDWSGKAGAYAVQGAAAPYITSLHGDFYTVVGLPVAALYKEFKELGVWQALPR
ncbi:Septum formation protein Maf [Clostridiaceae bacterium JG1575]|nr:Septum formation protein Maf [Clostridiaceae bacterium JG1575]